jgi:hypothetical protein
MIESILHQLIPLAAGCIQGVVVLIVVLVLMVWMVNRSG